MWLWLYLGFLPVATWLFFWHSPRGTDLRRIRIYNWSTILVIFIICGAIGWPIRLMMQGNVDEAWWPVVWALYGIVLYPFFLLVGALARNIIFSR